MLGFLPGYHKSIADCLCTDRYSISLWKYTGYTEKTFSRYDYMAIPFYSARWYHVVCCHAPGIKKKKKIIVAPESIPEYSLFNSDYN